ncbi:MAG: hypothetical protein Q9M35_11960 [Rhodothermus sp.]|nr:hypothetical protein [Rhodothermus sp.]
MKPSRWMLFVLGIGLVGIGVYWLRLSPSQPVPSALSAGTPTAEPLDTLKGEIFFEGEALGRPSKLLVWQEYLIVGDGSLHPPLHIIHLPTGRYVASVGSAGEGPLEISSLWALLSDPSRPEGIWVWDRRQRRLLFLKLSPLSYGDAPVFSEQVTFQTAFDLFDLAWVNDTLLVASGFLPSGRLALLHWPSGRLLRTLGDDPPGSSRLPLAVRQHAYQRWVRYDPVTQWAITAYFYTDFWEVYRLDGRQIWTLRGADGFDPVFEVRSIEGQPARATRPDTRYAYRTMALLSGNGLPSLVLALYNGHQASNPKRWLGGWELHIVNLHTRTLYKYRLDPPAYTGLAVDARGCVYTIIDYLQRYEGPLIMRYCVPAHIRKP